MGKGKRLKGRLRAGARILLIKGRQGGSRSLAGMTLSGDVVVAIKGNRTWNKTRISRIVLKARKSYSGGEFVNVYQSWLF